MEFNIVSGWCSEKKEGDFDGERGCCDCQQWRPKQCVLRGILVTEAYPDIPSRNSEVSSTNEAFTV